MRAEAAGDPGPWRQQAMLGRGSGTPMRCRDILREYALETLGDKDAVLVIDENGFLKQGKALNDQPSPCDDVHVSIWHEQRNCPAYGSTLE
ncbi:SRSO17 transposase [Bradyrhizobium sp. GM24.11]